MIGQTHGGVPPSDTTRSARRFGAPRYALAIGSGLLVALLTWGTIGVVGFARHALRKHDLDGRLWSATCSTKPSPDRVRRLLGEGADPNLGESGFTVLRNAVIQGNPEVVGLLLNAGASIARTDRVHGGNTTLALAAARGDVAVTRVLLGHGADPTRADAQGNTALEMARGSMLGRTHEEQRRFRIVMALLKQAGAKH